jgi:hypothetical protein
LLEIKDFPLRIPVTVRFAWRRRGFTSRRVQRKKVPRLY